MTKCTQKNRQACDGVRYVFFFFLKFCNFIKGIVSIYIVFLKKLRQLFLYLTY